MRVIGEVSTEYMDKIKKVISSTGYQRCNGAIFDKIRISNYRGVVEVGFDETLLEYLYRSKFFEEGGL